MFRFFQPQLYLDSIIELTPEKLSALGLNSLLLDVDCTLKHYNSKELSPEVACWINDMKEHNIGLCLVSNGRRRRIRQFSESVQIPFIAFALKPFPFGLNRAVKKMNFDKKTTAMVGDQVFADILAGKFAGLFTILVTPLNPEDEPWFARMKRPLEKVVLKPLETPSTVLKHRRI